MTNQMTQSREIVRNLVQNIINEDEGLLTRESTITLGDGRVFPSHDGKQPLAWDVGAHFTQQDAEEGHPRVRAVVRAMQQHRPDQLERERAELAKSAGLGRHNLFSGNASRLLKVINDEIAKGRKK